MWILHFLHIEGFWQPFIEQLYWCHFSNSICSLHVCVKFSLILTVLWTPDAKSWLIGKDLDARKDWRQEEKGTTEDKMVGWHHWLNGHAFEQAPGVGDGQEVLQSMKLQRVGHVWVTEQPQQHNITLVIY